MRSPTLSPKKPSRAEATGHAHEQRPRATLTAEATGHAVGESYIGGTSDGSGKVITYYASDHLLEADRSLTLRFPGTTARQCGTRERALVRKRSPAAQHVLSLLEGAGGGNAWEKGRRCRSLR